MALKLPPALAKYVAEKVKTGRYASADDVLVEAVRVMKNVEDAVPGAEDDLRREIDLGLQDIEEGRVSDWDVEEMKRELLKRAKKAS